MRNFGETQDGLRPGPIGPARYHHNLEAVQDFGRPIGMSQTAGSDRWWALVGPRPTGAPTGIITVPHDGYRFLASEVDIGPLHLRPGGTRLMAPLTPGPTDSLDDLNTWG